LPLRILDSLIGVKATKEAQKTDGDKHRAASENYESQFPGVLPFVRSDFRHAERNKKMDWRIQGGSL